MVTIVCTLSRFSHQEMEECVWGGGGGKGGVGNY